MLEVYTDGSSRHNGEKWIGAYAYAIYKDGKAIYQSSKNLIGGTVNMCELIAVANAIHTSLTLYPNDNILIKSDSKYVLTGILSPLSMKTNKKGWNLIHQLIQNQNVKFDKVKAHEDDIYNNHVDKLAKEKLREYFNREDIV